MENKKTCNNDKELNPYTNKCVKKCPDNKTRKKNDVDKSFKCVAKKKKLIIEDSDDEIEQVKQIKPQSSNSEINFPSTPKEINSSKPLISTLKDSNSIKSKPVFILKESNSSKQNSSMLGDPCKDYLELLEERKKVNLQINSKNRECEETKFGSIQKYFNKEESKTTCKDLLIALQKLYITARTSDPNYTLYFHDFINMFARDTMVTLKFKRQHVFESICKLLLLYNYDNFELGASKQFYKSLENFIQYPNNPQKLNEDNILNTKLNESSAGGVVDIFFESEFSKPNSNCNEGWGCDCETNNIENESNDTSDSINSNEHDKPIIINKKRQFVLIQNKYYEKEKQINKNYDVTQIYATAEKMSSIKGNLEKKIILMVNNAESLDQKILRAKNTNKDLINKIYGVKQLEDWFRKLLNELFETKTIEEFLKKKGKKSTIKPELQAKFHQVLFTQSTLRYNIEEGTKLFIWGAVPRSGKSYMIADLISKSIHRNVDEQNNDIVLILGAKSETECQFINMFCEYSDFDDYGIISASYGIQKTCPVDNCKINKFDKDKYIFIFSQEWFKTGNKLESIVNQETSIINKTMTIEEIQDILQSNHKPIHNKSRKPYTKNELLKLYSTKPNKKLMDTTTRFKDSVINSPIFKTMLSKRKIDLFFDEIHKGGSTNNSENILHAFINAQIKIDIFVMVTATFAKPDLRYSSFKNIDTNNKGLKIIEWGYEDQQNMKQVTNNTNMSIMINNRSGIEKDVISQIFEKYKNEYGVDSYLKIISDEYIKHPQLVLIQPEQINSEEYIDIRNVFIENLKCDACKEIQSLQELRNPNNVFNDVNSVEKMINFIGSVKIQNGIESLEQNSVYGYLHKIGAPVHKPHSELWFLPDKDLYLNSDECRTSKICGKPKTKDDNYDEDDLNKTQLPNIEPLTRGLAFLLMNNPYFREHYNVLIVHNTNIEYENIDKTIINADKIFGDEGPIYHAIGSTSLSKSIKDNENKTFKPKTGSSKSLIILTGAKLRLGISLPCVDIAFNFDNIKSIDNNYQTMFRVLTERKHTQKPYGYYIDFNKERAVQFLYEYNNTYGSGKKIVDSKTKTEYLQSLLILFNYNGLGLIKQDTNKQLELYKNLVSNLELDESSYQTFNLSEKNISNLIKKSLTNINSELLQRLKGILNSSNMSKNTTKIRVNLIEGNNMRSRAIKSNSDSNKDDDSEYIEEEEDENTQDNDSLSINTIAEILPSIIALLALFSDKNNYNCNTLEDCINNCISNLDKLRELCNCGNVLESSIFACYMLNQSNISYTKENLKKLLFIINEIIQTPESQQLYINLNIIFNNIRETMGKNNEALIFDMTPENIQNKIEQYLPVREEEKNKHGEVFTPIELIEDMFDKLPSSVWSNPDMKWLDPANGIGNFPMIAYQMLMNGLEKWEPSKIKRSKHIIENMLYMVEINPKNVQISKKIFGPNANICCANFLEESEKCFREFGVSNFDIIIGNPPFQDSIEGKSKHGSGKLYPEFIERSIDILVPDGLLLFVTPNSWFAGGVSKTGKILELFKTYNLLMVNSNNISKYFPGVGTGNLVYFLVKKNNKYNTTELIDTPNHNFNVRKFTFLPNILNNFSLSICEKTLFNNKYDKFDLIKDSRPFHLKYGATEKTYTTRSDDQGWVSTKQDSTHKYRIFHTNTQTLFSSKENFFSKHKKILISQSSKFDPFYDDTMGFTQNVSAIIVSSKKEGEHIIKILHSKLYSFLLKCIRYSANITIYYLDFFPYPKDLPHDFTDNDLYKYFKLTQNEINYINNIDSKIKNITKIQALTRGRQQRKKNKKTKKGIVKLQAITRGVLQRKKTKRSIKKGGKKTYKKSLFKFW
jgi:adenine-specific DNA-methyltransferase